MPKKATKNISLGTIALVVVIVALRALTSTGTPTPDAPTPAPATTPNAPSPTKTAPAASPPASDDALVERLFREERSDEIVTVAARVKKTLPDDNDGSRHQRFILELATGRTLLVAHNIDLAPRVPLREGDTVVVHGEYEWSQQGGVLHWTHHDPGNRREGGWIEHAGQRYE